MFRFVRCMNITTTEEDEELLLRYIKYTTTAESVLLGGINSVLQFELELH